MVKKLGAGQFGEVWMGEFFFYLRLVCTPVLTVSGLCGAIKPMCVKTLTVLETALVVICSL